MEAQKKTDSAKGLKITLLVLLAAWALFLLVYWMERGTVFNSGMLGINKLASLSEIVTGVMAFIALLIVSGEKNKGILWGVFFVGLLFALSNIWNCIDRILYFGEIFQSFSLLNDYFRNVMLVETFWGVYFIYVTVCGIVAMTCHRWKRAKVVLGICIGLGALVCLLTYTEGMLTLSYFSYFLRELCFMIAMPLFYMWVAKKRLPVSEDEQQESVQIIQLAVNPNEGQRQYSAPPSGGLSAGARNEMIRWVNIGGKICLLAMIVGSFLPFFSVGSFSFASVLRGLIGFAGDDLVQGMASMAGYGDLRLMAYGLVIGIVILYLLEWKAFRRVLDYPEHRGYGWNIWLMLSSIAGVICFCTIKYWFDVIGSFSGVGNVAGVGLIMLQWSHIVLFVLSIMAVAVKSSYNGEQRRRKMGVQEQTYGASFSNMSPRPAATIPDVSARPMGAPVQNVANVRFCTKCGHPLAGDAMFCGECGTKVVGKMVCKGCGRERAGVEKFCTKCGMKYEEVVSVTESMTAEADLFTQAFAALEAGVFSKSEELSKQILATEPDNAMSYVIALMAQRQIRRKEELATGTRPLTEFEMYCHALSLADDELKEELEGYNRTILDRNMDKTYSNACEAMRLAETAEGYELKIRKLDEAIAQFDKLEGWKDSKVQIEICESQKQAFTKQVYDGAKEQLRKATEDGLSLKQQMALLQTAADEFKKIEDAYDSEQLYEECMRQKAECEKAQKAKKRKKIFIFVGAVGIAIAVCVGSVMIAKANKEKQRQERLKQEQYDADYAKMQEQIVQGHYEDAIETMTSSVAYSKAEKMVQEAVYELANDYVDKKMYEKAEDAYKWLGDYEDCEERREMLPELEFLLYAEIKTDASDGTYTLVKVDKDKAPSVVVVPDKVSQIGVEAFADGAKIEEIVLPDGITYIGDGAFKGCSSLSSIEIPEGVTSIGNNAFYGCSGLTSVTIPEGVTSIGDNAFYRCFRLSSIEIPEGVTSIGDYAFYGCSSLSGIEIPEGVTSIGESAFEECSSLTSVAIPESVTSIGDHVFYGCSSLSSIEIPEGVTRIGNSAFYGCIRLSSIEIPEGVTRIGNSAFYGCSGLTSVTIPERVISIGGYAFYRCFRLSSIEIPERVTSIGDYAFYGCSSLTSVTIPERVTSIRRYVFYGCSSLSSIEIPEGVTSIGGYAFSVCSSLTSVTIPESVTNIEWYVFEGCSKDLIFQVKSGSYAHEYLTGRGYICQIN